MYVGIGIGVGIGVSFNIGGQPSHGYSRITCHFCIGTTGKNTFACGSALNATNASDKNRINTNATIIILPILYPFL